MTGKPHLRWEKFFTYLCCIIMSLAVLIPLYMVVLNSLKSSSEAAVIDLTVPQKLIWENYVYVFREGKLGKAFLNSCYVTGVAVLGTVVMSSVTAFIIARRNTRFANAAYNYFLMGLIAPMALIPEVVIMNLLHLSGSYAAVILIHLATRLPLSVMLYTGFIKGIPRAMDESAMLDGAPPLKLFFSIIFPLLKPVVFTNIILTFMAVWNDFQIALYFIGDSAKQTIPLSIYNFVGFMTYQWNYVCAFIVLSILPILVVYLCAQRYIIDGMIAGAVKQ